MTAARFTPAHRITISENGQYDRVTCSCGEVLADCEGTREANRVIDAHAAAHPEALDLRP